jgi:hypothetical protein
MEFPLAPPALKEFMFNSKILPKTSAFLFVFAAVRLNERNLDSIG